jgi:thiosulfate/3-mercaptopyruvate sulfurtransferase
MAYARPELLAEPDWLAAHLEDPDVRIIDCATLEAYRRAHIPGAVGLPVHFYIKEEDPKGSDHGVFVMPPGQFEDLMNRLGVSAGTTVVTYDDNNSLVAARLWWVLNYYGHTAAKVLNGGWHRWLSEGRPVTFHATRVERGSFSARPRPELYADADAVLEACEKQSAKLMDVRTDEEWAGTNDRGNRRAGRVPGAEHLEWIRFVTRDDRRTFLPAEELQRMVDGLGFKRDEPIITYCQGGIRAAHAAFVLNLLGYEDVRVYDGSMRDWANRDDTPLVK